MINENFYLHVNNHWLINNPVPNDKARWSQFDILNEKIYLQLKNILENKLNNKLSKLYYQSLETFNNIDKIKEYIDRIDSTNNFEELLKLSIDYFFLFNIDFVFNFYACPNFNDSIKNILFIDTGGLGLPSKEYYFLDSYENIRIEYIKFISDYSKLFNLNIDANKIFNLEKKLAEKTYTSTQSHDFDLITNIRSYDEIVHDYPKLEPLLKYYLKDLQNESIKINIINPRFLKLINELEDILPLWKDFLKFKLVLSVYFFINDEVQNLYCEFYEKKLTGKITLEPKWKKSINKINNLLGQELGQCFVNQYYNIEIENNIKLIIEHILNNIRHSIVNNTWLSEETKNKALIKINKMTFKIGKPDKKGLYDYSNLLISDNYFDNIINCIRYNKNLEYNELYKDKNRERWHMTPQTVNAYYSPTENEFVLTAGILNEPFYFKDDIIKSFSGIGFIIGHEIIHSIDNHGRLFDENGNKKDWWTFEDNKKYIELSDKLVEQYNSYNVNGKLTLGENIADLGGLSFALYGLISYLKNNKYKLKCSYFKTFFINYAQCLACNTRPEKYKELLLTDPHSPNEFRVNGILKNIDIFSQIFKIDSGNMFINKSDRIKIW